MPTQEQYVEFLKKVSTIRHMHIDIDFFHKETKDQFEYLKANIENLSGEDWDEILSTQDSSILHETLKNPKTPKV